MQADSTTPDLGFDPARYHRQMILQELGLAGQQQLTQSRVLIVGLGGLGSPVAQYLAAAGVGTLGLADPDVVERSNLHRQVIHDDASLRQPKVISAAARLQALNPEVRCELHPEGVTVDNALELFGAYDLIVDGTDNFPTRYLNNDAAVLARKPLVYGSIFQFEGQVSVFDPAAGGPCYRCLFPAMPPPGSVPNCAEAGVLGALCGVIGSLQAIEALKYLVGMGKSLRGRLFVMDTLTGRTNIVNIKSDQHCPVCGTHPEISRLEPSRYQWQCAAAESTDTEAMLTTSPLPLELSVTDSQDFLDNASPSPLVVDVREDFELAIVALPEARHIPLAQLAEQASQLPTDRPILTLCHHGGRSLHAARYLRKRGFEQVASIKGGIDAWAEKVNPRMARY